MTRSSMKWTYKVTKDRDALWFFRGEVYVFGNLSRQIRRFMLVQIDAHVGEKLDEGIDLCDHDALIVVAPIGMTFFFASRRDVENLMERHGERAEQVMARLAKEKGGFNHD